MNCGLPYQGSKNQIAARIVAQLPDCPGGTLYDLFCGGCAITHAAMLASFMGVPKFARFVASDINPMMPNAFLKAVSGGFRGETRWISREEYHRLKHSDPYAALCFSFGNNPQKGYAYSAGVEPYQRACHYAIVFGDWAEFDRLCPEVAPACHAALSGATGSKARRLAFGRALKKWCRLPGNGALVDGHPLYRSVLNRQCGKGGGRFPLPSQERLERLQDCERLVGQGRLEILSGDYQSVPITGPGVIYCDPPYKGTTKYLSGGFDYDRFYDWCERQELPVFISEYAMPADRFVEVFSRAKRNNMCATQTTTVMERLYRPRAQPVAPPARVWR